MITNEKSQTTWNLGTLVSCDLETNTSTLNEWLGARLT